MNHKTKKTKRMRLLALLLAASLILNLACITDYAKASGRKKAYSGEDYRIELTENSVWDEGSPSCGMIKCSLWPMPMLRMFNKNKFGTGQ